MSEPDSSAPIDDSMHPDELLTHIEETDEKLASFLEVIRTEHQNGKSPLEIVNKVYYEVDSGLLSNAKIEYHIVLAVIFGVLWEKHDNESVEVDGEKHNIEYKDTNTSYCHTCQESIPNAHIKSHGN